jgi:thioredoxin reductase
MSETADVAIVGSGPAGLSAALVLGRCRRSVVLFDAGRPRNHASHAVHCLLGHDGVPPSVLLAKGRSELERYPTVKAGLDAVIGITPRDDGFVIECEGGAAVSARKVLLATGLATRTLMPSAVRRSTNLRPRNPPPPNTTTVLIICGSAVGLGLGQYLLAAIDRAPGELAPRGFLAGSSV